MSQDKMTAEAVDELKTLDDALDVMDKYGIPYTDTDNTESCKTKIKAFLNKGSKQDPISWTDTVQQAKKIDEENRSELRKFYGETQKYVNSLPDPFQPNLKQIFPGLDQSLMIQGEELKESKCMILVAGDNGAGKSSIVNLLIGYPLLPTNNIRCTAAIVEISYADQPSALAYYQDDSYGRGKAPVKIPFKDKGQFLEELAQHCTRRDPETDESPYELIKVFWPTPELKCGVKIVDSPGIGDSRRIPQQLSDYIGRASGFLYVFDSTAAINRTRFGAVLLKADERNDGFQHKTTMFLCNRWDRIGPQDSERVLDSMFTVISNTVPGVQKSQLYPISVKESFEKIEYGLLSERHIKFLFGLRQLLPSSLKGKLFTYYKFLLKILERSLYTIRVSLYTQRDKIETFKVENKDIQERLGRLQNRAKEALDNMRDQIDTSCLKAGKSLLQYFDSTKIRIRITSWNRDQCPPYNNKWQALMKSVNVAVASRVSAEVIQWENENSFMNNVVNKLVEKFQTEFRLIDEKVTLIRSMLLSKDCFDLLPHKNRQAAVVGGDHYYNIGAVVAQNFVFDHKKDGSLKKLFQDQYKQNPQKAMHDATTKFLDLMTNNDIVNALQTFLERLVRGVERVGKEIPMWINAEKQLLADINQKIQLGQRKMDVFPKISKSCSDLQSHLDFFFVTRLMETKYRYDQIELQKQLGSGSFAVVYRGKLSLRGGQTADIAVKEPTDFINRNSVTDLLSESNMLKNLDDINIVKFHGVCLKQSPQGTKMLFLMEFCPSTLKKKFIDSASREYQPSPSAFGNNNPEKFKKTRLIMTWNLLEICRGLKYLHDQSIVHRDLKPENILLSENGTIKIADFGLAKKIHLMVTHGIGTPVYMAPEVLLTFNSTYGAAVDVYSLAMIMWELWYGMDLAKYASEHIEGGLKEAMSNEWRPSMNMIASPDDYYRPLIQQSWSQTPDRRPTIIEIGKSLKEYYTRLSDK